MDHPDIDRSRVLFRFVRDLRRDNGPALARADKQAREFDPDGDHVRRRATLVAPAAAAGR